MNDTGLRILGDLQAVKAEYERRDAKAGLAAAVHAIKHYQHQRFSRTYADLLAHPRYAATAQFFLSELYGPHDFRERDAQFMRVVPSLVRLFPQPLCETVAKLTHLHALTEALDGAMGQAIPENSQGHNAANPAWSDSRYAEAWRRVGRPEQRQTQIQLTLEVGRALDAYTRKPGLRQALRLMRRPANAAGLGDLQRFLETGFDTFGRMQGADEFLNLIAQREAALVGVLFAGGEVTA
jgi:hypothetical protein